MVVVVFVERRFRFSGRPSAGIRSLGPEFLWLVGPLRVALATPAVLAAAVVLRRCVPER